MSDSTTVHVTGDRPYDVVIGRRLLGALPGLLGTGVRRVLVVHPAALATSADAVLEDLRAHGYEAFGAEVPDAEEAKTAQVAAFLWQVLGQADFTRSDAIVAVGGGATTDLAGFVAATWLRGIAVVQVPTTLLAMVDAAVGGKTGINTAEGKNLVGAFHPPAGVLCDLAALASMPKHDFVAGLAEVIKCGFIADPVILDLVEANTALLTDPVAAAGSDVLFELVERAVAVKARVVGEDLREAGLREILNYGHTFAHAIEQVERFQWRHGAAVAVGMVYVAELARLAGRLPDEVVDRHRSVLTSVGLPVTYRGDRWDRLLAAMRRDKKTRGDLLRFVVLEDVGRPARLEGPDPTLLAAAYAEVSEGAVTPAGHLALATRRGSFDSRPQLGASIDRSTRTRTAEPEELTFVTHVVDDIAGAGDLAQGVADRSGWSPGWPPERERFVRDRPRTAARRALGLGPARGRYGRSRSSSSGCLGASTTDSDAGLFIAAGRSMLGPGILDVFATPALQMGPLDLAPHRDRGVDRRRGRGSRRPSSSPPSRPSSCSRWRSRSRPGLRDAADARPGPRSGWSPRLLLGSGLMAEAHPHGAPRGDRARTGPRPGGPRGGGRQALVGRDPARARRRHQALGAARRCRSSCSAGGGPSFASRAALAAAVGLGMYAPFALLGHLRTFDFAWTVSATSTVALVAGSVATSGWAVRLVQGAVVALARCGARPATSGRPAPVVVAILAARLLLDPLRLPYYPGPLLVVLVIWTWTSTAAVVRRWRVPVLLVSPLVTLAPYLLTTTAQAVLGTAALVGVLAIALRHGLARATRTRTSIP